MHKNLEREHWEIFKFQGITTKAEVNKNSHGNHLHMTRGKKAVCNVM